MDFVSFLNFVNCCSSHSDVRVVLFAFVMRIKSLTRGALSNTSSPGNGGLGNKQVAFIIWTTGLLKQKATHKHRHKSAPISPQSHKTKV